MKVWGVSAFILGMCYFTYTFFAFPLPLTTMFMPFCKLLRRTPSTEYMRIIFPSSDLSAAFSLIPTTLLV